MPIEIREIVIKAQLEKDTPHAKDHSAVSEQQLWEMKQEIMADLLEKMEEKLEEKRWSNFKR